MGKETSFTASMDYRGRITVPRSVRKYIDADPDEDEKVDVDITISRTENDE